MKVAKRRIGDKEVFPFTIPSGIITTEVSVLERIAWSVPEIGILTTKSIGPEPRAGNREPILAEYAPHCFVNAVGLTNPGAEEFARRLKSINIPREKFLLVSIFGKDAKEFASVAEVLRPYADGFELNLSCPHAKGYGMQLGQDPVLVKEIVEEVKKVCNKPVFAKLTPNTNNIADIARAAMNGGAYGLTAINTVGPGAFVFDGHYVLTNKVGGLSGRGITPVGIKCVKEIADALGDVPIIGCGGIYTAQDVVSYAKAGASFFGVGSALAGMNVDDMPAYFQNLANDVSAGTNIAEILLKTVDMKYKKFKVGEKISSAQDFHVLKMAEPLEASPGQFVFAWIPGKGEKPFSVMDTHPLTIGFLERGCFTKELAKLSKGDELYFRGPYGNTVSTSRHLVLVGGGSGIAGIYLFAKQNRAQIFVGAKDIAHVPCLDDLENMGDLHVATEDGSAGYKGFVSDLMRENLKVGDCFINCGPRPMLDAVLPIELPYRMRIYSSLDRMTRCGVGICGSCADDEGRRTCKEGPFMPQ
ncbi:Sulfhydrogenase 1 subunit gamma [uncultured archaeon]|nr:Sulfhydrogenase 1 subunit gamma [uncultured archaeon]